MMQNVIGCNAANQLAGAADDQFIRILLDHDRTGHPIIPVNKGIHNPFTDRDPGKLFEFRMQKTNFQC